MRLAVLSTGSKGNCYVLESKGRYLLLDVGIPYKEILKGIGYNLRNLDGAVITHEHGDHAKSMKYLEENRIPFVYWNTPYKHKFGGWDIYPFRLIHDVPCLGYLIINGEESLMYLTDTEYCKYVINGVKTILCECNYDIRIIDNDAENFNHVVRGHMELQTLKRFLKASDSPTLKNIIMCHPSKINLDESTAFNEVKDILPDKNVYIAEKGMKIELKEK